MHGVTVAQLPPKQFVWVRVLMHLPDLNYNNIVMEKLLELLNDYELTREGSLEAFKGYDIPLWKWELDCD